MSNYTILSLEERAKYIEVCKELIVKAIGHCFNIVPSASRIEFFMELPNHSTPYRDNPLITEISIWSLVDELLTDNVSQAALGELNLVLNLCGIGLINLFPCGKVVLYKEHYTP